MDTYLIVAVLVLAALGAGFGWLAFNHAKAAKLAAQAAAAAASAKAAVQDVAKKL